MSTTLKPGPRCHECPLKDSPGPVWGKGPADAKLCVIGQNPGPDEINCKDENGYPDPTPFVGSSGRMLNRGMYEVGIRRDKDVFVTNVVKCFVPPGKRIPYKAVMCCLPLLYQELDQLPNLKVKATMGIEAFNALTGRELHMQHNRKSAVKNSRYWLRGHPFRLYTTDTCPIIPLEHPASIMRGGFLSTPWWQSDWRKVKRWFDGKGYCYEENAISDPTEKEVDLYIDKIIEKACFGVDIETPEQALEEEDLVARAAVPIEIIGLSCEIGETLQVPPPLFHKLDRLFNHDYALVGSAFNWGFDGFHLGQKWDLSNIRWYDVMLAYNLLYSTSRPKDLAMALSVWTDIPYHKNLQHTNPEIYNNRDTYGAYWAMLESWEALKSNGLDWLFWHHEMPLVNVVEDLRNIGIKCDTIYAKKAELTCYKQLLVYEKWWRDKIPQYSWTSTKDLQTLFVKLKMPVRLRQRTKTDKQGNKVRYKSPSLDEDVLEEYRDKFHNQTAGLILEMRRLKHAADFTHIYSSDQRCHSQYKIHGQKQGRIQSKDPDVQNIPEEVANIHPRKIIVGDREDHVVIVADFNQIELWTYAYCAGDIPFLLAKERGDYIYGQLYEEIFNEPFFVEGKPRTKRFRREDTPPWKLLVAKSGPLGWIYGRGAASMRDLGVSEAKANEIHKRLEREHHAITEFHNRLIYEAGKYGYLRNLFGRIRLFPNIRGQRNELLSFPGQSNAADILRANALLPFCNGLTRFRARTILTVHDSVGVSCPKSAVHECVDYIKRTMESPIPQMKGFVINVEIKVGPNWQDGVLYDKWCEQQGVTQ